DPILRRRAKHIADPLAPWVQQLIDDTFETMHFERGVGLAAPQVSVSRRLAVIDTREESLVVINPRILRRKGSRVCDEGCLSIPGYVGEVRRSAELRVEPTGRDGERYRVMGANGLLAQALEHEIDHLNGVLYLDHLLNHEALRQKGIVVPDHPVVPISLLETQGLIVQPPRPQDLQDAAEEAQEIAEERAELEAEMEAEMAEAAEARR
ncbi:MAG: peptide deformylase, partial [Chloroflexi bacterium]|nr:peptide deformylase [Chloroflexota bacterium]